MFNVCLCSFYTPLPPTILLLARVSELLMQKGAVSPSLSPLSPSFRLTHTHTFFAINKITY